MHELVEEETRPPALDSRELSTTGHEGASEHQILRSYSFGTPTDYITKHGGYDATPGKRLRYRSLCALWAFREARSDSLLLIASLPHHLSPFRSTTSSVHVCVNCCTCTTRDAVIAIEKNLQRTELDETLRPLTSKWRRRQGLCPRGDIVDVLHFTACALERSPTSGPAQGVYTVKSFGKRFLFLA